MARALRLLRASAGLVVHPTRLRRWRAHLSRAWHQPGGGGSARPARTPGPRPRKVRVLVHADERLVALLRPEWRQVTWDGAAVPPDVELVVLGWPLPGTAGDADALATAAARSGRPLLVWDTADPGAPTCPVADRAGLVRVAVPERLTDYDHPDVAVLSPGVQPREHNPVRTGRRVPLARLGGADPVFEEAGDLGPEARRDRAHDVVVQRGTTARPDRVLELLAEGTVVVTSDPALAQTAAAVQVVDRETAPLALAALARHPELRRRAALAGVREALARHSTTAAVDEVLAATGVAARRRARPVTAIVPTMRPGQIDHVLATLARQRHEQVQLVLITHGFEADPGTADRAREAGLADVRLLPADADLTLGALMNLGVEAADGEYVAKMDDDNHYGPHYLGDLLATFDFSGAHVAGKWAHLTHLRSTGATFLRFPEAENTYTRLVQGGTMVMPRAVAAELRFEDVPRRVDTTFLEKVAAAGGRVYSADRYNFVSVRGASVDGHTWKISDTELLAKPSSDLFYGEPWAHADV